MAGIWLLPNSGLCSKPVMWWTALVVRLLCVLFVAGRFLRESGTPRPTKESKTSESRSYVELENCANKIELGLWGGEESKNYLLVLKSLSYRRGMMLSCVASEDRIQPSRKMLLRHRFLVPQKEHRFLKIKLPAVVALEGVSELFPSDLSRWLALSSSLHPDLHTITLPAFSWKLLTNCWLYVSLAICLSPDLWLQWEAGQVFSKLPSKERIQDFLIPLWSLEFQNIFKTSYPSFTDEGISRGNE